MDGTSLKPLLEGQSLPSRKLYWHYPHYGNQGGNPSSIIREGPWKLIHYWEDGTSELYNLKSDPSEGHDLSGQELERTKKMQDQLVSWLYELDAKIPEPDQDYNAALAEERRNRIINERWPALERQRLEYLSEDFDPNNDWWGSRIIRN